MTNSPTNIISEVREHINRLLADGSIIDTRCDIETKRTKVYVTDRNGNESLFCVYAVSPIYRRYPDGGTYQTGLERYFEQEPPAKFEVRPRESFDSTLPTPRFGR